MFLRISRRLGEIQISSPRWKAPQANGAPGSLLALQFGGFFFAALLFGFMFLAILYLSLENLVLVMLDGVPLAWPAPFFLIFFGGLAYLFWRIAMRFR